MSRYEKLKAVKTFPLFWILNALKLALDRSPFMLSPGCISSEFHRLKREPRAWRKSFLGQYERGYPPLSRQ